MGKSWKIMCLYEYEIYYGKCHILPKRKQIFISQILQKQTKFKDLHSPVSYNISMFAQISQVFHIQRQTSKDLGDMLFQAKIQPPFNGVLVHHAAHQGKTRTKAPVVTREYNIIYQIKYKTQVVQKENQSMAIKMKNQSIINKSTIEQFPVAYYIS